MKKLFLYSLIIPLIVTWRTDAQFVTNVSKVGTTAAPFLEIEVGARAIGMGGAFVAVANDATALYWNPAGIARLPRNEVSLIHTEWLAGINYDFAGIVMPLGRYGALGASIISLSMEEMEVRTVFYPEGTGERFDAGDMAAGLSYAISLTDRFSIGGNVKYIQQQIWHMKAFAFALDIGTLFTTQFDGLTIGMSITNFGNKMRLEGKDTQIYHDIDPVKYGNNEKIIAHLDTDRWPLPLIFRVGLSYDLLKGKTNRLTLATDALHPNDNTECINLGLEYAMMDFVYLRAGYKSLFQRDTEEGFTAGAGVKLGLIANVNLKADYAYADFGVLDNTQRFSLAIGF